MRILHVNKFLYRHGGAEAYMLELADLQRAAGHEVEFFGMEHQLNPPHRYADRFPKQVQLDPPPPGLGRRAAVARMVYSPAQPARHGGGCPVVPAPRRHLHSYHQLSPSVLVPLARAGVPTVMTLHDYKLVCPSYLFLDHGKVCEACLGGFFGHAVVRRCKDDSIGASAVLAVESTVHRLTGAYGSVRVFVCPSRFLAAKMAQAGVYPDRLQVLSNFVDVCGLATKTDPGGPVVYMGRLWPEKGIEVLIEAIGGAGRQRAAADRGGPGTAAAGGAGRHPGARPGPLPWLAAAGRRPAAAPVGHGPGRAVPQPGEPATGGAGGIRLRGAGGRQPPRRPARAGRAGPLRGTRPRRRSGRAGRRARPPAGRPDPGPGDGAGGPGPEPSETSGPERHLQRLMGLYARAGAAVGI